MSNLSPSRKDGNAGQGETSPTSNLSPSRKEGWKRVTGRD